jgi:hypothetical protein
MEYMFLLQSEWSGPWREYGAWPSFRYWWPGNVPALSSYVK